LLRNKAVCKDAVYALYCRTPAVSEDQCHETSNRSAIQVAMPAHAGIAFILTLTLLGSPCKHNRSAGVVHYLLCRECMAWSSGIDAFAARVRSMIDGTPARDERGQEQD
jgi:hypothetical protein